MRLYWDNKTESAKRDFLGTISISIAAIAFSILILLFVFQHYVGLIYKSIDFYPFYVYAILIGFISVFLHVPKIYLMLKEKAGKFVVLSLLQFVSTSSLVIWFIIVEKEGAVGYLKGQMFGVAMLLPIFFYISFKVINFRFNLSAFKDSFSFSLPIIPTMMCAWVLNLSDRIFLERYFSLEEVGIYSLAYKIAGIFLIFGGGFSLAYEPIFFKLANSDDQLNAKNKLIKYNHLSLIASIFICFFLSFFAKEVISLAFNREYYTAHLFVPLIAFSYLIAYAGGLIGKFFQQSKKMKENMMIALLTASSNIVLNFLLIPRFGAYGAAYATILSMALGNFIAYYYSKKYCYFIPFKWGQIVSLVGILTLAVVYFEYYLVLDVFTSLILKSIFVGIIGAFFVKKYYLNLKAMLTRA